MGVRDISLRGGRGVAYENRSRASWHVETGRLAMLMYMLLTKQMSAGKLLAFASRVICCPKDGGRYA